MNYVEKQKKIDCMMAVMKVEVNLGKEIQVTFQAAG
jgi:hypothetical protein